MLAVPHAFINIYHFQRFFLWGWIVNKMRRLLGNCHCFIIILGQDESTPAHAQTYSSSSHT